MMDLQVFTLDTEEVKQQMERAFEVLKAGRPVAAPLSGRRWKESEKGVDFYIAGDLGESPDLTQVQNGYGLLEFSTPDGRENHDETFIRLCKKYGRFPRVMLPNPIGQPVYWRSYDTHYITDMVLKRYGRLNPITDTDQINDMQLKDDDLWLGMAALYGNIDIALGLRTPDRIFRTVGFVAQKLHPQILKQDRIEGGQQTRFRRIIGRALDFWADCRFKNYLAAEDEYMKRLLGRGSQFLGRVLVPKCESIREEFERAGRAPLLQARPYAFGRRGNNFLWSAHIGVYDEGKKVVELPEAKLFYRNFQNTHGQLLGLYEFLERQLLRI